MDSCCQLFRGYVDCTGPGRLPIGYRLNSALQSDRTETKDRQHCRHGSEQPDPVEQRTRRSTAERDGPAYSSLAQALTNRFLLVLAPRADMAVERNRVDVEFWSEFGNRGVAALHTDCGRRACALVTLIAGRRILAIARNSPHLSGPVVRDFRGAFMPG